jgi:hypothetical protein
MVWMDTKVGLRQRIRNWYDENKETIKSEGIRLTWLTVGAVVGGYIADKAAWWKAGNGMKNMHDVGLIKFVDPSNGNELTSYEEINKVAHDVWLNRK